MSIYALLNSLGRGLEERLQHDGKINSYAVDIIPDDLKINVMVMKAMPIKHIKVSYKIKV